MKMRYFLFAIFLLPACHVCVGQANLSGVSNNTCCKSDETTIISNNAKGEIISQGLIPSPVVSSSPTASPTAVISPSPTVSPTPPEED